MRIRVAAYKMAAAIVDGVQRRSGPPARLLGRLLYGNPLKGPRNGSTLEVGRPAALGDVLMCTPVLRELKRRNPRRCIRFYTNYGSLVKGLPYIDEVLPYDRRPTNLIELGYEHAVPPEVHISRIIGDKLGLKVTDTRPDCIIRGDLVDGYRKTLAQLPAPRIVFLRRASVWTPNKNWPDSNWVTLINSVARRAAVIEVGQKDAAAGTITHPNYVDLRGETSLEELVALIAASDLYVGPVSGPMHIAVSVGTPSVTICGGYESPRGLQHAPSLKSTTNVFLSTDLPCAPCWLREPCPIGLKCLKSISPARVEQEMDGVLGARATEAAGCREPRPARKSTSTC
jgi:ADP-heptose:LPS heptosyltransferase